MRYLPLQKLLFATLAMSCLVDMTSRKAPSFHRSQCHAFSTNRFSPFLPNFSQRHDCFHRTFLFLPTKNIQRNLVPPTTKLNLSKSNTSPTPPPPLPQNTEDPFLLLGLDTPTADLREIKRAYRKRAMQYHPDVVINADSTPEERAKASRDFARINAAYEMLKGGGSGSGGAASSGGAAASSRAGTSSYVPPHRRQGGYSSSSYGSKSANNYNVRSTNWEDYMPNYDAEDTKYDADGDSFGAIFSDLISGAVGAASGYAGSGAGIFGDFVDFLERNVDGFQSGYDDDKSLSALLMYGSFEDIAEEMDETDMLVTSLEKKLSTVENERMQIEADLKLAQRYSEKLDLEEKKDELNAREKIVKGYLKKGRNRLVRLRERYKELMVQGRGGRGYGTGTSRSGSSGGRTSYDSASGSSSRATTTSSASSTSSSTYSSASSTQSSAASSSKSPSTTPATAPSSSSGSSWRNEGFSGDYGRRSSSSRRGRRASSSGTADASSTASSTNDYASNGSGTYQSSGRTQTRRENVYGNGNYGSSNSSGSNRSSNILANDSANKEAWKPPHRRTESATESATREKRRLRELRVDDEFERLKKEMGL
mmetsp:Transcript_9968/g.20766  ORF Transcript_9968/g.20766 Transcript_9968/m.20766 type:complete len:595 (+) Transcript_9968:292-2076(+)